MTPSTASARPRRATVADVDAIVELHATRIADGFLVSLGRPFLRRVYHRMVRARQAFVLVATDDAGHVCGFVAVALDTGAFYKEFLRRDGITAALAALPGIARAPRSVFETMRYGLRGDRTKDGPAAEIMATAVDERVQRRGYGARLVKAAVDELQRLGVSSARVVTALGNDAAIRTYEHGGFHRHGFDEVHRDVTQEVLVWP